MDKIAVLIPCYNEATTIEKIVKEYKRFLPEATVYVYDNNSTDGTDEIARAAGAGDRVLDCNFLRQGRRGLHVSFGHKRRENRGPSSGSDGVGEP